MDERNELDVSDGQGYGHSLACLSIADIREHLAYAWKVHVQKVESEGVDDLELQGRIQRLFLEYDSRLRDVDDEHLVPRDEILTPESLETEQKAIHQDAIKKVRLENASLRLENQCLRQQSQTGRPDEESLVSQRMPEALPVQHVLKRKPRLEKEGSHQHRQKLRAAAESPPLQGIAGTHPQPHDDGRGNLSRPIERGNDESTLDHADSEHTSGGSEIQQQIRSTSNQGLQAPQEGAVESGAHHVSERSVKRARTARDSHAATLQLDLSQRATTRQAPSESARSMASYSRLKCAQGDSMSPPYHPLQSLARVPQVATSAVSSGDSSQNNTSPVAKTLEDFAVRVSLVADIGPDGSFVLSNASLPPMVQKSIVNTLVKAEKESPQNWTKFIKSKNKCVTCVAVRHNSFWVPQMEFKLACRRCTSEKEACMTVADNGDLLVLPLDPIFRNGHVAGQDGLYIDVGNLAGTHRKTELGPWSEDSLPL